MFVSNSEDDEEETSSVGLSESIKTWFRSRMLDIFESNERLIKKDLLALGVGDAVRSPVFVLIPIVPFKTDTIIQFVVDSHSELYITIIYNPRVEKTIEFASPVQLSRLCHRAPGPFPFASIEPSSRIRSRTRRIVGLLTPGHSLASSEIETGSNRFSTTLRTISTFAPRPFAIVPTRHGKGEDMSAAERLDRFRR